MTAASRPAEGAGASRRALRTGGAGHPSPRQQLGAELSTPPHPGPGPGSGRLALQSRPGEGTAGVRWLCRTCPGHTMTGPSEPTPGVAAPAPQQTSSTSAGRAPHGQCHVHRHLPGHGVPRQAHGPPAISVLLKTKGGTREMGLPTPEVRVHLSGPRRLFSWLCSQTGPTCRVCARPAPHPEMHQCVGTSASDGEQTGPAPPSAVSSSAFTGTKTGTPPWWEQAESTYCVHAESN